MSFTPGIPQLIYSYCIWSIDLNLVVNNFTGNQQSTLGPFLVLHLTLILYAEQDLQAINVNLYIIIVTCQQYRICHTDTT